MLSLCVWNEIWLFYDDKFRKESSNKILHSCGSYNVWGNGTESFYKNNNDRDNTLQIIPNILVFYTIQLMIDFTIFNVLQKDFHKILLYFFFVFLNNDI